MGSLSMADRALPFMAAGDYEQACSIVERVIERLASQGRHFSGVMNSGFFATAEGVKVIEFNARFGDPECINIISLFEGSWPAVMEHIAAGSLRVQDVRLREEASVVLYLVSPDYALRQARRGPGEFGAYDTRARADRSGGMPRVLLLRRRDPAESRYRTVGTSRAVALASTAPTLEQARVRVAECAATVPVLEWRRDVGDGRYLEGLRRLVAGDQPSRDDRTLRPRSIW